MQHRFVQFGTFVLVTSTLAVYVACEGGGDPGAEAPPCVPVPGKDVYGYYATPDCTDLYAHPTCAACEIEACAHHLTACVRACWASCCAGKSSGGGYQCTLYGCGFDRSARGVEWRKRCLGEDGG
jgi:hypothetical protein